MYVYIYLTHSPTLLCRCPATGDLYFLSDQSNGFWNVHRVPGSGVGALDGSWAARAVNALPRAADFGGSAPGWALGGQGFCLLPDGTLLAPVADRARGGSALTVVPPPGGGGPGVRELGRVEGLPYAFDALAPGPGGALFLLGTSPAQASAVYKWRGLEGAAAAFAPAVDPNISLRPLHAVHFSSSPYREECGSPPARSLPLTSQMCLDSTCRLAASPPAHSLTPNCPRCPSCPPPPLPHTIFLFFCRSRLAGAPGKLDGVGRRPLPREPA